MFDRNRHHQNRLRAASGFAAHDVLLNYLVEDAVGRLSEIRRHFVRAALIGLPPLPLLKGLQNHPQIGELLLVNRWPAAETDIVADDELLPFTPQSLDLILSIGTLHMANDVPGVMAQAFTALKPDGLLLALFPGGRSLMELRDAFLQAAMERGEGVAPRISPFIDIREAGQLLQRAGFALPMADSERLTVCYADAWALMRELRGMGQGNVLEARLRRPTSRSSLAAAVERYHRLFADAEGRIPASVEFIAMTGWKPHESQQQPAKRGSGTISLLTLDKAADGG